MNRVAIFLIAAVIFGFVAEDASAQIGRGRLLKKMRDDLFVPPNNQAQLAKEQAARAAQQKLEAARKAQLEQQKKNARQPTPIGTGANRQPAKHGQPSQANRSQANRSQANRPSQPKPNVARGNAKQGFGFLLTEKNEKLIVSKVDPNGNAAGEGIRPGDVITGIGGVEVETTAAFDEIAEILSNGDTIEIALQRGGKPREIQVAYGEAPIPEESEEVAVRGQVEPNGAHSPSRRTADFAPPRQTLSDQPSRNFRPSSGAVSRNPGQVEQLNSLVRQQSQRIQALENELRTLRSRAGSSTPRVPTRGVNSVLDPALN